MQPAVARMQVCVCVYTIEHISRFLTQYGEAAAEETHRVRLFLLSLSGLAFTWFALLLGRSGEAVPQVFFHRDPWDAPCRSNYDPTKEWSVSSRVHPEIPWHHEDPMLQSQLDDGQLAELAFQGILPLLKKKYSAQEFECLGQII